MSLSCNPKLGASSAALTPDSFHATHLGCNDIGAISVAQAIFIEVITTFTLVITVFSNAVTAASPANGNIAPIPIGFAVILGILATGNVSGGSMNPARSIGPAVAAGYWHVHYVYWVSLLPSIAVFVCDS